MAIDSNNEKLALMEMGQVWEPGLPISPSTIGQDDRQQLLWGYPGILWASIISAAGLVKAAFSTKDPGASMTVKKPKATMTGKRPDMNATGRRV